VVCKQVLVKRRLYVGTNDMDTKVMSTAKLLGPAFRRTVLRCKYRKARWLDDSDKEAYRLEYDTSVRSSQCQRSIGTS
jgi:hypothetical protein